MSPSRKTFLAGLLAGAALLGACGGGQSDAELVASARTFLEKQDPAAAIIQLKAALQKNPNNAQARLLLGRSLLDGGDGPAAAIELRKAAELGVKAAEAQPPLARAMLAQGQAKQVVEQFAATTLDDPQASADLKTTLATAYAALGQRDKALEMVLAALKDAPQHAPALLLHARVKAASDDLTGALTLVDQVLAQNPKHVGALLLKGDLQHRGLHDRDAAIATYTLASQADPKAVTARAALITLLLEQGKTDAAREQFTKLKEAQPKHPEALLFEARFAYLDRNFVRARELTEPLLQSYPNDLRVLQLAGLTELQLNSLTRAESHLSRVMQAAPNAAVPRQLLARIYTRTGQPGKALAVLKPLTEGPKADSNSLTLAGEALLQTGDLKAAEAAFARAAKDNPQATTARTALALGQMARGDTQAGFSELETVAAADSGTRADMTLIAARLRSRDIPGAMKAIAALEKKRPDSPVAHGLRGSVLLQTNDTAGATASFEKALKVDPLYFPATAALASIDLAAGKPEAARRRFEDLLRTDPKNASALLGLAELKARTGGSKDEVNAAISAAVKANPDLPGPRVLLINQLLGQRDAKAAMAAAQDATAALPDSVEVIDALGRAQLAAGQSQQAVTTFTRLAALRPELPGPELSLAEAHAAAKDLAAARRSLNKVLAMRPGFLPAQRALGQIALREDKPAEALRIAQEIQKSQPKQAAGHLLEADVEFSRKRPAAAIEPLRKALQLGAGTDTAVKLHAALNASQRAADAERLATTWTKDHPRDAGFRYYLGDAALARKDYTAAEASYRSVLEIRPDDALAMNNVAWILAQQRRPGALALAEKANELVPNNPALMDTLAWVLALEKQPKRAIELQRKAMAQAPEAHGLRLTLAKIYLESGDKVQAKTELETLAKLGEKFGAQAEVTRLLATL